ncbi:hypothetical protein DENSPDRAFT_886644 [Dentipellis sp. KUC8613]|nr:hypothetical protein DENSPDRAFT_886644 [Dentipellis sp. KUC8613]
MASHMLSWPRMPTRGCARSSNDTTGACAPPARVPRHHAHSQRRAVPLARLRNDAGGTSQDATHLAMVHRATLTPRRSPVAAPHVPEPTQQAHLEAPHALATACRATPTRLRAALHALTLNDPRRSPIGPHGAVLRALPPSACPAVPTTSSVHPAVPFAPRPAAFEPHGAIFGPYDAIFGPHGSVLHNSPPSARPAVPSCAPRCALLTRHGAVSSPVPPSALGRPNPPCSPPHRPSTAVSRPCAGVLHAPEAFA